MIIDKAHSNHKMGFEPDVLYCFNNNLKGILCNRCKSNLECKKKKIY